MLGALPFQITCSNLTGLLCCCVFEAACCSNDNFLGYGQY